MSLLFSAVIFLYFVLLGRGALALVRYRFGHVRSWLLAPAVGLAIIVLSLLVLNQAGLPVRTFAATLAVVLLVAAIIILVWRKISLPATITPFLGLVLLALLLSGWPALHYGLNWLSYGNDDMTNYCLGATRMLNNGFYKVPVTAELAGTDYSQYFWFMHVLGMMRNGSELLLAGVAGATHLLPIKIFMPVILAIALTQMWALAALVYTRPSRRKVALISCLLLAFSPLFTYGTLLQLIAQVGGLALLFSTYAVLARSRFPSRWQGKTIFAIIPSLLLAALLIFYPEVLPFLFLALTFYFSTQVANRRRLIPGFGTVAIICIIVIAVILRHNIYSALNTLVVQVFNGFRETDIRLTIFPYFLIPQGLSFLFGFEALSSPYQDPISSIATLVAGLVLILIIFSSIRGAFRGLALPSLLLVMVLVGMKLLSGNNGFGCFKLAMFITPLISATLATFLARPGHRGVMVLCMIGICTVSVFPQYVYVKGSMVAEGDQRPSAIYRASGFLGNIDRSSFIIADLTTIPIAKIAANHLIGTSLSLPSRDFFKEITSRGTVPSFVFRLTPSPSTESDSYELFRALNFDLVTKNNKLGTVFVYPKSMPRGDKTVLLTSQAEELAFNKIRKIEPPSGGLFDQRPFSRLTNHLVFITSELGQNYYLGDPGFIAVYQSELDFYAKGSTFFGIGKYLLFEVVNPSAKVRIRLSMTDSLLGGGNTRLPNGATLNGASAVALPIIGSGSANVFSESIEPLRIDDAAFVALNLNRHPSHIPTQKTFINRYFNSVVSLDPRLINGFCRDISVVSEDEYSQLPRSTSIKQFPDDLLANPGIEYSGIYEDGWLSKNSFIVLGPVKGPQQLTIKGMLPHLPDSSIDNTILEVMIDGVSALQQSLKAGEFQTSIHLDMDAPKIRIDLSFKHEGRLPSPDNRPISAKLISIEVSSSE